MKGDQPSESNPEDKSTQAKEVSSGDFEGNGSKTKRRTIHIKLPPKPSAPAKSGGTAIAVPLRHSGPVARSNANDLPLRITSFALVSLLALAYCHFFFEYVRGLPLQDFLPIILWPAMVHKLLGVAILSALILFERERKTLCPRSRWIYCALLGSGIALFVCQWIIRW